MLTLSKLPSDLLVKILSYLEFPQIADSSSLSRSWNEVKFAQQVWRAAYFIRWKHTHLTAETMATAIWKQQCMYRHLGECSKSKLTRKAKVQSAFLLEDGKYKRRKKTEKIPGAPKQAKTPFICFSAATRKALKKSEGQPMQSLSDIGKQLAAAWKALSPDEKQRFVDESERDKARFMTEKGSFVFKRWRARYMPNAKSKRPKLDHDKQQAKVDRELGKLK